MEQIAALAAAAVVLLFVFIYALAKRYRKVGPNQVLVISGRKHRIVHPDGTREEVGFRIRKGGGAFIFPIIEKSEVLSLEIFTLDITTPEVYTAPGVPIIVDGVAQVKVRGDDVSIRTAAERFLSKGDKEIMNIAQQTVEGHLRAILGQMSVEDIYRNRDVFAQKVQEVAADDMANMGLAIDSFTLRDIKDTHGYLDALGKPRTAQVKRDAVIAQAEADRDATIRSAQAIQAGKEAEFGAQTQIANAEKEYQIKKASFDKASNQTRADADLAYDLQKYKTSQAVKEEEIRIQVIEKEMAAEVQDKEIARREKELNASVRKPAEAERFRVETIAQAEQFRFEAEARGRAEAEKARGFAQADVTARTGEAEGSARKAKGFAEAEVVLAQGQAEAKAMAQKADSWAKYNEAAILQMFMEVLPKVAESVAAPLSQIDKMVVINAGGDGGGISKITGDIANTIGQIPPVIESLTGLDLKTLIDKVPGLRQKLAETVNEPKTAQPHPKPRTE